MKIENLAKANELAGKISKLEKKIALLQIGAVSVIITPNKATDPLVTIGTGENCEHDLAGYATDFVARVRLSYNFELQGLKNEFEAL